MKFVLPFEEIDRHSLPFVGGKGANLGEMLKAGLPVPPGFCITTAAYRRFMEESDEMDRWLDELNRLKPEQLEEIRAQGRKIRDHIRSIALPDTIRTPIIQAWARLGTEHAYAVRSSATAEDLPTASFAGQQETRLNVRGEEELLEAVKRCWASLFTDRAIVYRIKNGFDHRSVSLSVVVQRMVFPEVSGILFTADPVTGHRRTVSIEAVFGLGEGLASGLVNADLYKVRDDEIVLKQIANKEKGVFPVLWGGTEVRELPSELHHKQVLSDSVILELAALARRIEKHFGSEQDVEWCLEGDEIHILQSRPITSLYPVPSAGEGEYRVYLCIGHSQMMTDYMKPLGISVFRSLIPDDVTMFRLSEAGGRLFWDVSNLLFLKFVQRKLLKSTVADDNLSALKKAVQSEDFKRLAPRRGVWAKACGDLKGFLSVYRKAFPRLIRIWYWGDPESAAKSASTAFERDLDRYKEALSQLSGAERIRLIRKSNFFDNMVDPLALTYAGIFALLAMKRKIKKWLGEEWNPSFEKSPPGNITSEMGLMIGDLADAARSCPEVIRYLEQAEDGTFYEGLARVEGSGPFREKLDEFMKKFGMRGPGEIDITRVRYREAPTMLVAPILSHLRNNAPGEHREKFERGAREARDAVESLLRRVRTLPGGARKARKLARLMALYRNTVGIRELPKYIIIRYLDQYREALLEEAQALVEKGLLGRKEDVGYLELDELILLLEGRLSGDEAMERIRSRKASEEIYRKLTPPLVITSEGETFSAGISSDQAPPGALVGIPASSGVAEGYVRVVHRLEEGNLKKGEILVAPYMDPGWTPLFHSAKALVTEVGGMMTHGSVIAREYGIPAVVSVQNATRILRDGQYIRVDGSKGYVEILDVEKE